MKKLTALLLPLICLSLTACTAPEGPAPSGSAPAETSLAVPEEPTPPPEPSPEPEDGDGSGIIGHKPWEGVPSDGDSGIVGTQPGGGSISESDPEPTESHSFYTLEEFKKSVTVLINEGLDYDPQEDMIDIVYASSHKWLEKIFTGMVEDYRCTNLELYDVSEDKSVFCYSMRCEFKCEGGEPPEELMAGNTVPADEEGWWRFSRQVKVERDGEVWKVTSVGTGGISAGK